MREVPCAPIEEPEIQASATLQAQRPKIWAIYVKQRFMLQFALAGQRLAHGFPQFIHKQYKARGSSTYSKCSSESRWLNQGKCANDDARITKQISPFRRKMLHKKCFPCCGKNFAGSKTAALACRATLPQHAQQQHQRPESDNHSTAPQKAVHCLSSPSSATMQPRQRLL